MTNIKFGTDGWRGIIAKDFTFDNLELVAKAISNYLNKKNKEKTRIIVGYDNRFLSKEFAEAVTLVFQKGGIDVLVSEKPIPTPVTAFAIKDFDACGAVMLTASHNPPEYNGIKFIPEYAGPALPYITDEIEKNLINLIDSTDTFITSKNLAIKREFNIDDKYLEHIKSVIEFDKMKNVKRKVIFNPMYGAGIGYLKKITDELGWESEEINNINDPLFGGQLPEPSEERLKDLKLKVLDQKADLGLALDGDADRFGVIDKDGTFLNSNEILYILLYHLIEKRGWKDGAVARTVATTHMLDIIAEKNGLNLLETSVGFKYIGDCLLNKGAFLGGEESGGLSIKGHIPEKDGILANCLMMEISALHNKPFVEIKNEVQSIYGEKVSQRLDVKCDPDKKAKILETIKKLNPTEICSLKVINKITIDGIKFVLENDNWCLIRPSGTEPIFRIYVETNSLEKLELIQNDIKKLIGLE